MIASRRSPGSSVTDGSLPRASMRSPVAAVSSLPAARRGRWPRRSHRFAGDRSRRRSVVLPSLMRPPHLGPVPLECSDGTKPRYAPSSLRRLGKARQIAAIRVAAFDQGRAAHRLKCRWIFFGLLDSAWHAIYVIRFWPRRGRPPVRAGEAQREPPHLLARPAPSMHRLETGVHSIARYGGACRPGDPGPSASSTIWAYARTAQPTPAAAIATTTPPCEHQARLT